MLLLSVKVMRATAVYGNLLNVPCHWEKTRSNFVKGFIHGETKFKFLVVSTTFVWQLDLVDDVDTFHQASVSTCTTKGIPPLVLTLMPNCRELVDCIHDSVPSVTFLMSFSAWPFCPSGVRLQKALLPMYTGDFMCARESNVGYLRLPRVT